MGDTFNKMKKITIIFFFFALPSILAISFGHSRGIACWLKDSGTKRQGRTLKSWRTSTRTSSCHKAFGRTPGYCKGGGSAASSLDLEPHTRGTAAAWEKM